MPTVRFTDTQESSIHNLHDAPLPISENIALSPLSGLSPQRTCTGNALSPSSPSILERRGMISAPSLNTAIDIEEGDHDDDKSTVMSSTPPGEEMDPLSSRHTPDSLGTTGTDDDYTAENESDTHQLESPHPLSFPFMAHFFRKRPNWNLLSSNIVRHAPCFWCCTSPLQAGATDRSVLFRLNILCAFFALLQMGSAAFLLIIFFAPDIANRSHISGRGEQDNSLAPNLWNVNGYIFLVGIVGLIIFITMLSTLRYVRFIDLLGSIRYLWALLWILPVEIFMIISLFDVHRVTVVWVKHWWYVSSMAWFREKFCVRGTSQTLCVVPVCGLPLFGQDTALPDGGSEECLEGERSWCRAFHNATNCTDIRDDAQKEMETASFLYYTMNAVWGLLLIVLLMLIVHRLESIVTKPIVQRSRESNVPGWLTFPIIGCAVAGSILLFSHSSVFSAENELNEFWIAVAYLVAAGLFITAAVLGWFISVFTVVSQRDLRTKHAAVLLFIITMVFTTLVVVAIFAASIIYSVDLVDFPLTNEQRGTVACFIDTVDSCSFCDSNIPQITECPQWTEEDVVRVLRTQLKGSAVLAAIFFLYSFSAMRFGFVLRKHVTQYQIDYV